MIWFRYLLLLTLAFGAASCGGEPEEPVVEKKVDSVAEKIRELEQWYKDNKRVIRDRFYSIELMLGHVDELKNCDLDFSDWSEKDLFGYIYFDYVFDSEDAEESDLDGGYWQWRRDVNVFVSDTGFLHPRSYEGPEAYNERLSSWQGSYKRFLKLKYLLVITTTEYQKPSAAYQDFRSGSCTGEIALVSLDSNCVLLRKTITAASSDEVTVYGAKNSMRTDAAEQVVDDLKNNFLQACYAAIEKKQGNSSK